MSLASIPSDPEMHTEGSFPQYTHWGAAGFNSSTNGPRPVSGYPPHLGTRHCPRSLEESEVQAHQDTAPGITKGARPGSAWEQDLSHGHKKKGSGPGPAKTAVSRPGFSMIWSCNEFGFFGAWASAQGRIYPFPGQREPGDKKRKTGLQKFLEPCPLTSHGCGCSGESAQSLCCFEALVLESLLGCCGNAPGAHAQGKSLRALLSY